MSRIILGIFKIALAVGVGEVMVKQTYLMATRAENAMRHDSLSYAKFTKAMIQAKPRKPANP